MKKHFKHLLSIVCLFSIILCSHSLAASYPYSVIDIAIVDSKGTPISYEDGDCTVQVTVQKNQNAPQPYVIVMCYAENNKLLSLNYGYADVESGSSWTLGTSVSVPDGEKISNIKATVWGSLESLSPLAEVAKLVPNTTFTPPSTTPPASDDSSGTGTFVPSPDSIIIPRNRLIGATSTYIRTYDDEGLILTYNLATDSVLYVNGRQLTSYTADTFIRWISDSVGEVVLTKSAPTMTEYDRIDVQAYALATVSSVTNSAINLTAVSYPSALSAPGVAITAEQNTTTISVSKNGLPCSIADLNNKDVVAIDYNGTTFDDSTIINIKATDKVVTGVFSAYNADTDEYKINEATYQSAYILNTTLELGGAYIFRLDPFGRLYAAEDDWENTDNFAIVESYVTRTGANATGTAWEYDYINVVTLNGEAKRLEIENSYSNTAYTLLNCNNGVIKIFKDVYNTAAYSPMQNRVIRYSLKPNGRINKIDLSSLSDPYNGSCNVYTFGYLSSGEIYDAATNTLSKPLAPNAKVLDATDYDTSSPNSSDYRKSSLNSLVEGVRYRGFLVYENASAEYCHVVITFAGEAYSYSSDFAVAAADAAAWNCALENGEEVYQLDVIEKGNTKSTTLNISLDAELYYNGNENLYEIECARMLKEGAVFFYTTNEYGYVDRIDVLSPGGYGYDELLSSDFNATNIATPASYTISLYDWMIDIDKNNAHQYFDYNIQLFVAPVTAKTDNSVTFAKITSDDTGNYVNINDNYTFTINSSTNLYSYNMSGYYGSYAFKGGNFKGLNLSDTTNGKAYFSTLGGDLSASGYHDFYEEIQMAFVMAVDGVVTNAIVFNP